MTIFIHKIKYMKNGILPLPVTSDEVSYREMVRDNSKVLKSIKDKPYFTKGDFVLYKANCLDILDCKKKIGES